MFLCAFLYENEDISRFLNQRWCTLAFNNNLLALNQLLIFVSSFFIFSKKMLISLCEKKRFVWSTNIIGFSTWCKSFTYNRNKKVQDGFLRNTACYYSFFSRIMFKRKKIVFVLSNSFQTILDYSQQYHNILIFLVKFDDQLCRKLWINQQTRQE